MMTLWTVALAAVVLICALLLALPLLGRREPWDEGERTELDELLAEKARVLRALKDIEGERHAGMLRDREYEEVRAEYVERAVQLNRRIAALTGVDAAEVTESAETARGAERRVKERTR